MELKTYLGILLKKWWIIIPIFLVTLTTAIVITYTTTPTYSSTATFVVAPIPSSGSAKDYTNILSILSNREQILTTYTEVASSNKYKRIAAESIELESVRKYSVVSDIIKGSNLLKVTVTGPNPEYVRDLANAIGDITIEQVSKLYQVYVIETLDDAKLPSSPISPNKPRDISLAAILGMVLGGSIAFLVSYLESPADNIVNINIIDIETGVYNKDFFLQRLNEEMVRAKRNHYPLSIALMRITNLNMLQGFNASRMHKEALHHVGLLTKQHLREEDLVAYMGENTFAFLLPDTTGPQAQSIMEYLQTRVTWAPFQSKITSAKLTLNGVVGIAAYSHNGAGRNQFLKIAIQALQQAEVNEHGKVYLKSEVEAG